MEHLQGCVLSMCHVVRSSHPEATRHSGKSTVSWVQRAWVQCRLFMHHDPRQGAQCLWSLATFLFVKISAKTSLLPSWHCLTKDKVHRISTRIEWENGGCKFNQVSDSQEAGSKQNSSALPYSEDKYQIQALMASSTDCLTDQVSLFIVFIHPIGPEVTSTTVPPSLKPCDSN